LIIDDGYKITATQTKLTIAFSLYPLQPTCGIWRVAEQVINRQHEQNHVINRSVNAASSYPCIQVEDKISMRRELPVKTSGIHRLREIPMNHLTPTTSSTHKALDP
jgi:hypothetical protein